MIVLEEYLKYVAARLRVIRLIGRVSQDDTTAGTGISRSYLINIESDKILPSPAFVVTFWHMMKHKGVFDMADVKVYLALYKLDPSPDVMYARLFDPSATRPYKRD